LEAIELDELRMNIKLLFSKKDHNSKMKEIKSEITQSIKTQSCKKWWSRHFVRESNWEEFSFRLERKLEKHSIIGEAKTSFIEYVKSKILISTSIVVSTLQFNALFSHIDPNIKMIQIINEILMEMPKKMKVIQTEVIKSQVEEIVNQGKTEMIHILEMDKKETQTDIRLEIESVRPTTESDIQLVEKQEEKEIEREFEDEENEEIELADVESEGENTSDVSDADVSDAEDKEFNEFFNKRFNEISQKNGLDVRKYVIGVLGDENDVVSDDDTIESLPDEGNIWGFIQIAIKIEYEKKLKANKKI